MAARYLRALPAPNGTHNGIMAEILTERLRLRAVARGDLGRIVEAMSDWAVQQWLEDPPYPYTEADALAWLETVARDHQTGRPRAFAVAERAGDRLAGCIALNGAGASPMLGYWVHRDTWGLGYATEAARGLLTYAREALGIQCVMSITDPDNRPSQRVLTKLGFACLGEAHRAHPTRRGATYVIPFRLDRIAAG